MDRNRLYPNQCYLIIILPYSFSFGHLSVTALFLVARLQITAAANLNLFFSNYFKASPSHNL